MQQVFPYGGIDALGRELPRQEHTGGTRPEKYVGLFYFLWLGQHGKEGPFDNSRILETWPSAVLDPHHPAWGPEEVYHFWGEPLYGYYLNDDAWVLRKHMQLLTSAGVDFIVFDTTNASTYKPVYEVLFRVMDELSKQGFPVPKFAFYTNTESGETVKELYDDIYKPGRYEHLWFRLKGRPLIIGNPDECDLEIRQCFTFRLNQWPNEPAKTDGFPWIEFERPQRVFFNNEGEKEIINVSVAQHPSVAMSDTPFYRYGDNWGRGFRQGAADEENEAMESILQGRNIAEQWEYALEEDPQIIFVTGWNEWIAMRLQGTAERPVLFVDQATLNFSRDIEPMKGGYGDLYYMQMIGYIRRFKGMAELQGCSHKLDASLWSGHGFSAWKEVQQPYRDVEGNTLPRRHPGYGRYNYAHDTGRNDLVRFKAAHTDESLCFYAQTKDPVTPFTGRHWMMMLLRLEGQPDSGWEGYHYIVNRCVKDASTTLLERSTGGWNWEPVAEIRYEVRGNELQLELPRKALGFVQAPGDLRFEFKWVDHMQNEGDITDFYQYGDAAPIGRLNFVYESRSKG
ncbi:hypothetical protein P9847_26515 [Paenibacillus chibensis]|uniref:Uncharacterized protein n=1 Tax=Paenibacillus chibensis TaxID=59846 RepID=A0ABU6Q112_9BACL|nr:hypothetical protein [Paenibacillus chibensis]